MTKSNSIKLFWSEIMPLLSIIHQDPENDKVIEQLDDIVACHTNLDWEYGPSQVTDYYFALSPNLNERLLKECDDLIASAPKLNGWEFLSGKPRKEAVLSWTMLNESSREIKIDTKEWRCMVYKFPDNTVDLDVKVEGVDGNLDTKYIAIDIHLTNTLGEINYMKKVKNVNIVSNFDADDNLRQVSVNKLYDILENNLAK